MLGARDDAGGTYLYTPTVNSLIMNGIHLPRLSDRYRVQDIEAARKGKHLWMLSSSHDLWTAHDVNFDHRLSNAAELGIRTLQRKQPPIAITEAPK